MEEPSKLRRTQTFSVRLDIRGAYCDVGTVLPFSIGELKPVIPETLYRLLLKGWTGGRGGTGGAWSLCRFRAESDWAPTEGGVREPVVPVVL